MVIISLIILLVLLFLGVPVFFSTMLSVAGFIVSGSIQISDLAYIAITKSMNSSQVSILLFVMTGLICFRGNLTERFFNIFAYFFGNNRIFRPVMGILLALVFASVSQSTTAVIALSAGMCMPLLLLRGYSPGFAAALFMCAGVLSFLIPPSTSLRAVIGLANITPDIGYYGGIILGLAGAVVLIVYAILHCIITKDGDLEKIQEHQNELYAKGFPVVFFEGLLALTLPALIVASMAFKIFTSTQAAAFSVVYSVVVSTFFFGTLSLKRCLEVIKEGLIDISPLLVLVFAANFFSACIEELDAVKILASHIREAGKNSQEITLLIFAALFVLGMFMDSVDACYMLVPAILPAAFMAGVEPYHLLIGLVGIESIGLITPPIGLAMYTMMAVSHVKFWDMFKNLILPMLLLMILFTVFALFPSLTPFIG